MASESRDIVRPAGVDPAAAGAPHGCGESYHALASPAPKFPGNLGAGDAECKIARGVMHRQQYNNNNVCILHIHPPRGAVDK